MGRAPCCDKASVKKGPWSPEEDAKLKNFIDKFGTAGNWIALPQKAGLKRCGKSCRLRWLNYLRPNIKHGEFSVEEDTIIFSLYSTIGSRWSIIASQLPGRTDNDIKNYFNTKLKKKLMGLIPSNTFQAQSLSLSSLPQLYRDYNSFYYQAVESLSTLESISSAPQKFLHCNNNGNCSLATTQYPCYQQNQKGLMDLQYYTENDNSILIFGGNEASCSSSDGSCSQMSCGKDREEIGCGFEGFVQNGFEETQKFLIQIDEKANGVLGEVEKLISTGNGSSNNCSSSNSFLFVDENKTHDTEMYY